MNKQELVNELGFWVEDDIVPSDLRSLLKTAMRAIKESDSGHAPAPLIFPHATRVTIVGNSSGVLFESYNAWEAGAELHQQDQGRTLKLFPKQY